MPFKSKKQRKYLWANNPKLARKWTDEYGSEPMKSLRKSLRKGSK